MLLEQFFVHREHEGRYPEGKKRDASTTAKKHYDPRGQSLLMITKRELRNYFLFILGTALTRLCFKRPRRLVGRLARLIMVLSLSLSHRRLPMQRTQFLTRR